MYRIIPDEKIFTVLNFSFFFNFSVQASSVEVYIKEPRDHKIFFF